MKVDGKQISPEFRITDCISDAVFLYLFSENDLKCVFKNAANFVDTWNFKLSKSLFTF